MGYTLNLADNAVIVLKEFLEVRDTYPSLKLLKLETGFVITGHIDFFCSHTDGKKIKDEYHIDIKIPEDYPEFLPVPYEKDGKISPEYHRLVKGALCLGTPSEQWSVFNENKNLLGYIEYLLIPYLFRLSYFDKCGEYPFSDRAHGNLGILEAYTSRFGIIDKGVLADLMKYCLVVGSSINKRGKCPCGSLKRTFQCSNHHDMLLFMIRMPVRIIQAELSSMIQAIKSDEQLSKRC